MDQNRSLYFVEDAFLKYEIYQDNSETVALHHGEGVRLFGDYGEALPPHKMLRGPFIFYFP